MFRFLYTLCDWLAGLCAVISPITILHWLLKSTNMPGTGGAVALLNPFFEPLNAIAELIIKSPPLTVAGHSISTTQAILAIFFTVGFFTFNFLSESLKTTEQRVDVGCQALEHQHRLHKLKSEEEKKHKKVIATERRLFVQIHYDFMGCPQGAALAQSNYAQYGAKLLNQMPDVMTLEFEALTQALKYALDVSSAILAYYAGLRPVDPQPSFKIAAHAVDTTFSVSVAGSETTRVTGFAGDNQIIFSEDTKALMDAQKITPDYQFQSVGLYALGDGRQHEMFRLFKRLK
jgi:hypothetical protein